jgi:hypothetical protein
MLINEADKKKPVQTSYQFLRGLSPERNGPEHDVLVYPVPPVPRREPLHHHVVGERRQKRGPREHLAENTTAYAAANHVAAAIAHHKVVFSVSR